VWKQCPAAWREGFCQRCWLPHHLLLLLLLLLLLQALKAWPAPRLCL
jgi:hypothetical protein